MTPHKLSLRIVAATLLGALFAASHAAPTARWTATDLTGMTVYDVNGQGKVVGVRTGYEGRFEATMYSAGTYTNLAPASYAAAALSISANGRVLGVTMDSPASPQRFAELGPGGRDAGFAVGNGYGVINDRGDIAGTYPTGELEWRAFLSRVDGTAFPIGPLNSRVLDMNNQGTVLGGHDNDFAKDRSFITLRDGATQYLPSLGGTASRGEDINDRGQVVGSSHLSGDSVVHATLYENGVLRDLGTLDGVGSSRASAINEAGQIAGSSSVVGGGEHIFLYENGVMKDIGTLGGRSASAWDINNLGQILGYSQTAPGNDSLFDYFIYDQGQMLNLDDLLSSLGHWDVRGAVLGDNGYIAGRAYDWETGAERSFLLSLNAGDGGELPEPASLALVLLAVAAAGGARAFGKVRGRK